MIDGEVNASCNEFVEFLSSGATMSSSGSTPNGDRNLPKPKKTTRPTPDPARSKRPGAEPQITLAIDRQQKAAAAAVRIDTNEEAVEPATIAERITRNRFSLSSVLVSFILHTALLVLLAWLVVMMPSHETLSVVADLFSEPTIKNPARDTETIEVTLPEQAESPFENTFEDISMDEMLEAAASENISEAQPDTATSPTENQTIVEAAPNFSAPTGGGLEGRNKENRARLAAQNGATEASEAAVDRGLSWLIAHQHSNGSWRLHHNEGRCQGRCRNPGSIESPNAATGLALLAFLGAGHTHQAGEHRGYVNQGLNYLKGRMRKTRFGGSLADDSMYGHGIATVALAEAYNMTGDEGLRESVELAVQYIVSAQHSRGGWRYQPGLPGDMTVTGWQLMALKSAQMAGVEVPQEVFDKAGSFLDSLADSDGAYYGYQTKKKQPTTTAIGLLMRMYLGWPRTKGVLDDGADYLADLGPSPTDIYHNYYATQVLHHLSTEYWPQWNVEMRDYLVSTQSNQGHENGSWHFDDEHGSVGGRLYTTAMSIMILEVYYRYMPLYAKETIK